LDARDQCSSPIASRATTIGAAARLAVAQIAAIDG